MGCRMSRLLVLAVAGGLAGVPAGCRGSGDGPSELNVAAASTAAGSQSSGGSLDPVERSRVREAAIAVLLEMTQSDDAQVRANALEGLLAAPARLEALLPAALVDPNEGVRTVAAMAVGKAKLTGLLGAVRPLTKEDSAFVRAAAIYALRACGQDANPTLLGAMVTGDQSPRVRAHAAYLLGELGDRGTSSLLRDAARLDVPRANPAELKVLSVQIAEALVKLGDLEQLHTIRAALYPATPEELDATVLATQVLGNLDDLGSAGQLRSLAGMRDPTGRPMPIEVRIAVAGALGAMGAEVSTDEAERVFASASEPGRIQAAWALGQIGGPSAVTALESNLGEPSERLRVAIATALLRAIEGK
jgi:HEAT repeat protein